MSQTMATSVTDPQRKPAHLPKPGCCRRPAGRCVSYHQLHRASPRLHDPSRIWTRSRIGKNRSSGRRTGSRHQPRGRPHPARYRASVPNRGQGRDREGLLCMLNQARGTKFGRGAAEPRNADVCLPWKLLQSPRCLPFHIDQSDPSSRRSRHGHLFIRFIAIN